MKSNNCYNCKYSGTVPGSAHLTCNVAGTDLLTKMMVMTKCRNSEPLVIQYGNGEQKAALKLNIHGIKNGWCDFPVQFDPIWVEFCIFHTLKNKTNV